MSTLLAPEADLDATQARPTVPPVPGSIAAAGVSEEAITDLLLKTLYVVPVLPRVPAGSSSVAWPPRWRQAVRPPGGSDGYTATTRPSRARIATSSG